MVTHLFSPILQEAMVFVTRGNVLSLCFEGRECATTSVYSVVHSLGKGGVGEKYQVAARSKIVCDVIAVINPFPFIAPSQTKYMLVSLSFTANKFTK